MKNLLMDLYNLNEEEYNKLVKKYSQQKLLNTRWEFMISKLTRPVTTWELEYYIEKHGNFIERGKRVHHHIARAIYNSLSSKDKVFILKEIGEYENGYENYKRNR